MGRKRWVEWPGQSKSDLCIDVDFESGQNFTTYLTVKSPEGSKPVERSEPCLPEDIDPACEEHAVKALMYGLTRKRTVARTMPIKWAH